MGPQSHMTSAPSTSSLTNHTFGELLTLIAAKSPTPGGGAVAGSVGAIAASLAHMVVAYSLGKKNLAQHQPALEAASRQLQRMREMYVQLAEEDAAAYGLVNELQKLPETDARRMAELPGAQRAAVDVPLAAMALSVELLRLCETLQPITNVYLKSDLGIATVLAEATNRSSAWNVHINLAGLPMEQQGATREQFQKLLEVGNAISRKVEAACR